MNRQQALNQLRLMQAWHEDFGDGPNDDYDAICYAIGVIEEMPEGMDTLINALEQEHRKLREMQKAHHEIIHCQNCKLYQSDHHWCELLESEFSLTDFCSYGERRTDDQRRSNQTI